MTRTEQSVVIDRLDEFSKRFEEQSHRTEQRFDEVGERIDAVDKTLTAHNGRLRKVEALFERIRGAVAVAGGFRPYLLATFTAALAFLAGHYL